MKFRLLFVILLLVFGVGIVSAACPDDKGNYGDECFQGNELANRGVEDIVANADKVDDWSKIDGSKFKEVLAKKPELAVSNGEVRTELRSRIQSGSDEGKALLRDPNMKGAITEFARESSGGIVNSIEGNENLNGLDEKGNLDTGRLNLNLNQMQGLPGGFDGSKPVVVNSDGSLSYTDSGGNMQKINCQGAVSGGSCNLEFSKDGNMVANGGDIAFQTTVPEGSEGKFDSRFIISADGEVRDNGDGSFSLLKGNIKVEKGFVKVKQGNDKRGNSLIFELSGGDTAKRIDDVVRFEGEDINIFGNLYDNFVLEYGSMDIRDDFEFIINTQSKFTSLNDKYSLSTNQRKLGSKNLCGEMDCFNRDSIRDNINFILSSSEGKNKDPDFTLEIFDESKIKGTRVERSNSDADAYVRVKREYGLAGEVFMGKINFKKNSITGRMLSDFTENFIIEGDKISGEREIQRHVFIEGKSTFFNDVTDPNQRKAVNFVLDYLNPNMPDSFKTDEMKDKISAMLSEIQGPMGNVGITSTPSEILGVFTGKNSLGSFFNDQIKIENNLNSNSKYDQVKGRITENQLNEIVTSGELELIAGKVKIGDNMYNEVYKCPGGMCVLYKGTYANAEGDKVDTNYLYRVTSEGNLGDRLSIDTFTVGEGGDSYLQLKELTASDTKSANKGKSLGDAFDILMAENYIDFGIEYGSKTVAGETTTLNGANAGVTGDNSDVGINNGAFAFNDFGGQRLDYSPVVTLEEDGTLKSVTPEGTVLYYKKDGDNWVINDDKTSFLSKLQVRETLGYPEIVKNSDAFGDPFTSGLPGNIDLDSSTPVRPNAIPSNFEYVEVEDRVSVNSYVYWDSETSTGYTQEEVNTILTEEEIVAWEEMLNMEEDLDDEVAELDIAMSSSSNEVLTVTINGVPEVATLSVGTDNDVVNNPYANPNWERDRIDSIIGSGPNLNTLLIPLPEPKVSINEEIKSGYSSDEDKRHNPFSSISDWLDTQTRDLSGLSKGEVPVSEPSDNDGSKKIQYDKNKFRQIQDSFKGN